MRKFTEFSGGQIDFREYRKPLQMPEFQTCACAISRLTYQHRLLRVGLPDTPEFLEQLTASAHADNVRGYLLFHAGIPVAFAYCYREDERLYYNTIGYDPSFSSWSPGTILLLLVLQRVCGERCFRIFDFGPGKAPYKSMFASGYVLCGDVYYFRWGLLNLIIVTSHAMVELISTSLGRFLERFGLKRRARDLLRRWSQRSSVI